MQDLGHVTLPDVRGDGALRIVQLTDLHQWPAGVDTFQLPTGREIHLAAEGYATAQNTELTQHVLERNRPDLVVLTGDIVDGRPCADMPREAFLDVMRDVLAPLADTPWTYVPGNHDDDHSPWTREDLLQVLDLPGCVSKGATTFDHTLTVGHGAAPAVRLWLFDSGTNSDGPELYTTYSAATVEAFRQSAAQRAEVELAYFHIPLPEYAGAKPLAGKNGLFDAALSGGKVPFPFNYEPLTSLVRLLGKDRVAGNSRVNSGMFDAMSASGRVLATFCGHDHHSDFVARRKGVYLCYGRCGGHTPPHDWEGKGGSLPFDHGARVVEVRQGDGAAGPETTTWVTTRTQDREDVFALARS